MALGLGATAIIDGRADVVHLVREATGGGADHTFEVVGFRETVLTAVRSVRKGGAVTLVGNLAPSVELPLQEIVSRHSLCSAPARRAESIRRASI